MGGRSPKAFVDLHSLSEDQHIDMIAHRVLDHAETVGFFVDDDPKADRYIRNLAERFPEIHVVERGAFKHEGVTVILVKVAKRGLVN